MRDLMAIIRDNELVKRTLREPVVATSPYLNKPLRTIEQVERESELKEALRRRDKANAPWHPANRKD